MPCITLLFMSLHHRIPRVPQDADAVLDLISRYQSQLWHTQRLSHSHCLRRVLLAAEQCWTQQTTAAAVSCLIVACLPQLWQVQQRAGSRQLRTVLNAVERLKGTLAGTDCSVPLQMR